MRLAVHAVGRMKAGPERDLAERYFDRFARSGPAVGLDFGGVHEIVESRARSAVERRRDEAERLKQHLQVGAALFLLDERGKTITSENFAERLATFRNGGQKDLVLAIGGPDGHDEALGAGAALILSFGALTWPHQLVRVMLAEQLYRAATILSGHPYHRA
jgi:23S rRNA (pseudouridine1915-N3)-methyltransferase